jgi:hypothetical protein
MILPNFTQPTSKDTSNLKSLEGRVSVIRQGSVKGSDRQPIAVSRYHRSMSR